MVANLRVNLLIPLGVRSLHYYDGSDQLVHPHSDQFLVLCYQQCVQQLVTRLTRLCEYAVWAELSLGVHVIF